VGSALAPNTTWTILAPDNAAFTSRLNESLGITPQQLLLPENRETLVQVSREYALGYCFWANRDSWHCMHDYALSLQLS
jgi:hypothetical protein